MADRTATLSSQISREFTIFSKLSVDLRLMIWRNAFPDPRHVDLVGSCLFGFQLFDRVVKSRPQSILESYHELRVLRTKFPVTLRINQESRAETLRHFSLVFVQNYLAKARSKLCNCQRYNRSSRYICHKVRLWINPKVDTVYFVPDMDDRQTEIMLQYLRTKAPKLLPAIRTLEIRDMRISRRFNMGVLKYFSGLEHLVFIGDHETIRPRDAEDNSRLLQKLIPFLRKHQKGGLRENVPAIHFTEYRSLSQGTLVYE